MKVKLALLALTVVLYGCSDSSSTSPGSPPATTSSISGAVTKGPVSGATVNVYRMDSSGQAVGDPVAGPIQTASDGSWNVDVPLEVERPLLVLATGGSYVDEATGIQVDVSNRTLSSFLTEGTDTSAVSPLSEAVVRSARKYLSENPGGTLDESVQEGLSNVSKVFGSNFDPLTDVPDPSGTTVKSRQYAAVLGGLSQLASTASGTTDPLDTVLALSEDVTDGVLDGQSDGQPIAINGEDGDLPAVSTDDYVTAVGNYTSDPDNGDFSDIQSFKVTATSIGNGTVSPSEVAVFTDDTVIFVLAPDTGYQVDQVSGCVGTRSGLSFETGSLAAACDLSVSFSPIPYTVTVEDVTGGTASVSSEVVLYNQSTSITFTSDTGYSLTGVQGCDGTLSGTVYTTGAIVGDCTVTPSYELQSRTVTLASNPSGLVTFDPPGPTASVLFGQQLSVTVIPDVGYSLDSVTGCSGSLNGDLYTTGPVSGNCTVTANVSTVPVYTVTASANGPGTISPSSAQVSEGASATFQLTPDANGSLTSVTGCSGTLSQDLPPSYTTGAVTADCAVTAEFDPIYTVTVNAGANGSASPTTADALAGEQPEISITPDAGYEIDTVGGTCGGTLNGTLYTVAAISSDCTVDVTFIEQDTPLPDAVWDQFNWDEAKWQ